MRPDSTKLPAQQGEQTMERRSRLADRDRVAGGLLGLLVGDALGVPYEFKPPEAIPPREQIEMRPPAGFPRAHAGVDPGTWSDDGAQALCLLASLQDCDGLNLGDFAKRLLRWRDEGYMAVDGRVFDIGIQTSEALRALKAGTSPETAGPDSERANGNGSLMRVLPLALWHQGSDRNLFELAMRQSLPTHGHLRSQLACGLYCLWARHLLNRSGDWNEAIRDAAALATTEDRWRDEWEVLLREMDGPATGTGYVVDSLVSARHALTAGNGYAEVLREAIALGRDTDTTAAIAGGLAGIRYGRGGIPPKWLGALRGESLLEPLMDRLLDRVAPRPARSGGLVRTSKTHPLKIGTLTLTNTSARIGVTFCPGKRQRNAMTGIWERNLDVDLAAIREWGATHLLTLLEAHEFVELGVETLAERAEAAGLIWHHAPMVDTDVPDEAFEAHWNVLGTALHAALERGESLVVHCKGGIGRAGLVAARLLIERGEVVDAADSIRRVRSVRPDAIENARQETFLAEVHQRLKDEAPS
jgi:ADP-ribosylglycohydrolase/protein-tyrosine phosphatase